MAHINILLHCSFTQALWQKVAFHFGFGAILGSLFVQLGSASLFGDFSGSTNTCLLISYFHYHLLVPLDRSVLILFWKYFFFDWGFLLPHPELGMTKDIASPFTPSRDFMISRSRRILPISWMDHSGTSSFALNTDGASRSNSGSFTTGGLLRDRTILAGFLVHLGHHSSNNLTESLGLLWGSQTVWFSWFFWFSSAVQFPYACNRLHGHC